MKNCKDTTKSAVEAADSITFHTFYGCHNISVIPEKITIKRSPVIEKQEIVRFNVTKAELQEKCLLNANTSLEIIKKGHATNLIILMKEQTEIFLKTRMLCITDAVQQESLIQDNCFNNVDIKRALEKMYETVELCIDMKDRFSEEKKNILLKQTLEDICAVVKHGKIFELYVFLLILYLYSNFSLQFFLISSIFFYLYIFLVSFYYFLIFQ